MPKRLLCVAPYPGELGWEIINYIPYINGVRKASSFDCVIACVRIGREGLYPFVHKFVSSNLTEDMQVSGNCGPRNNAYISEVRAFKERVRKMKRKGHKCTLVGCGKIRDRVMLSGRKFIRYKATEEIVANCYAEYGSKYAVVLVRTRRFGKGKNWSIKNFDKLGRKIKSLGFTPVYVGSGSKHKFSCGINLLGETTISDVIPILCGASFAVGGSTGTMHLASLCGTPHVVWGNKRLINRYRKDWNPHRTKVCFLPDSGWHPSVGYVVSELSKFLKLWEI